MCFNCLCTKFEGVLLLGACAFASLVFKLIRVILAQHSRNCLPLNIRFPAAVARRAHTVSRASPPLRVLCRPRRTRAQALLPAGSRGSRAAPPGPSASPARRGSRWPPCGWVSERGPKLLVGHGGTRARCRVTLQQGAEGPALPVSSAFPHGSAQGSSGSRGRGVLTGAAGLRLCSAGIPREPPESVPALALAQPGARRGAVRAPWWLSGLCDPSGKLSGM